MQRRGALERGKNKGKHFCCLPQRNWSSYFTDYIWEVQDRVLGEDGISKGSGVINPFRDELQTRLMRETRNNQGGTVHRQRRQRRQEEGEGGPPYAQDSGVEDSSSEEENSSSDGDTNQEWESPTQMYSEVEDDESEDSNHEC